MAPTTNRNLTIFAGEFPARSETFVRNHAAGFAQRGWRVEVMSSQPGESMSQTELAEVDAMGVTRSYWGAWSPSSAGRALQFAGELMRAPGLVAVLNGAGGWTRPEMFAGHRMRRLLRQSPTGPVHVHYGKYAALLVAAGWPGPAIVTWHGFDACQCFCDFFQTGAGLHRKRSSCNCVCNNMSTRHGYEAIHPSPGRSERIA